MKLTRYAMEKLVYMTDTPKTIDRHEPINDEFSGRRFDQVLAELFPEFSRARLQKWIKSGEASLNGQQVKPKHRVSGADVVQISAQLVSETAVEPECIPLDVVFEDEQIMIINKPPGLVVHPAVGHRSGTLQNALLAFRPELSKIPRAGIVHRLDKDTSGLMVVAASLESHHSLVGQLQDRSMHRQYDTLVRGNLIAGRTIDAPIGRHPKDRVRMAVVESGKAAVTHITVIEKFRCHTRLKVRLETGRTHQIRVHMAHIYHPVLGDQLYAGRAQLPPEASPEFINALQQFKRQALHAEKLSFIHPTRAEVVSFTVKLPDDHQDLINELANDLKLNHAMD